MTLSTPPQPVSLEALIEALDDTYRDDGWELLVDGDYGSAVLAPVPSALDGCSVSVAVLFHLTLDGAEAQIDEQWWADGALVTTTCVLRTRFAPDVYGDSDDADAFVDAAAVLWGSFVLTAAHGCRNVHEAAAVLGER